ECIGQAQQLGQGVVAEPSLASDLANYYRQHGQFEKATELLRPLAQASIGNKKAELADLDAQWGDDLLREGKLDQSLKCWEEVQQLQEGSRTAECQSRLATIYQKLAEKAAADHKDPQALEYLAKLTTMADNPKTYEMAADIYERDGQLENAI